MNADELEKLVQEYQLTKKKLDELQKRIWSYKLEAEIEIIAEKSIAENLELCPVCKEWVEHESYAACGTGACWTCCDKCEKYLLGTCEAL